MSLVTPLSRSSSATSESTSSRDSARTNLIALLSSALREPYPAPERSSRGSRWLIPWPPCPDVRGPWMQGRTRRRGIVAAPPPPSGGCGPAPRDACRRARGSWDQPSRPGAQVVALLGGELVDLHAARLELETRDLAIDRLGHRMHTGGQLARMAHEVLDGERLVGERHVHDRRRMP